MQKQLLFHDRPVFRIFFTAILWPLLLTVLWMLLALTLAIPANAVYAIAQYGQPKYPPNFTHFDYVNPNAPKRGTLTLANPNRQTSFDKFNPFTLRGNAAPGIGLLFETLTTGSADEVASAYGLLADDIRVASDGLSVTFHLNPKARFSNGEAVNANDVKYSYDTLMRYAAPAYRIIYQDIARVVVVDRLTVRFNFKRRGNELPLLAGGIPVFSPSWGKQPNGNRTPFDQLTFEAPIGSGPYLIERYDGGRTIIYYRNPAYWGTSAGVHLPVRRGHFNFERIVYKLYSDETAQFEAFKAGEFDAIIENRARRWVRSYSGKQFDRGVLTKREFRQYNGANMQGFFINTRRPLFADKRVRKALDLALDFEWANRQLFYRQYERIDSYFANSEFAASGLPSADELKLLKPLKHQLDPAVFGPLPQQPTTAPPHSLRGNLRCAVKLLQQAGWTYRNGALRNAKGKPFRFEILDDTGGMIIQVVSAYIRNLAKLGIEATFVTTDFALYQKRVEDNDFDMTTVVLPAAQMPGIEQVAYFSRRAANTPGGNNLSGVNSPAVDALLHALLAAHSRRELLTAAHALDRVLLHGYYVVPHWYAPTYRIAYRHTLAYPTPLPLYYSASDWIASMWWNEK